MTKYVHIACVVAIGWLVAARAVRENAAQRSTHAKTMQREIGRMREEAGGQGMGDGRSG